VVKPTIFMRRFPANDSVIDQRVMAAPTCHPGENRALSNHNPDA
jgi:hypothetical protein